MSELEQLHDPKRCFAVVSKYWPPSQCSRKGVIEEDGHIWCRQHAPSAVKKRNAESEARWNARFEARAKLNMDRAWKMVLAKLRKMDPSLADEVEAMAEKLNAET